MVAGEVTKEWMSFGDDWKSVERKKLSVKRGFLFYSCLRFALKIFLFSSLLNIFRYNTIYRPFHFMGSLYPRMT